MRIKLITAPVIEPVDVDDLKIFLRVDSDDNDEEFLITTFAKAARLKLEKILNKSFITQTWELTLDNFCVKSNGDWWDGSRDGAISSLFSEASEILLSMGPVQSITSVKYFDIDNSESTYSADNYFLDNSGDVHRLIKNDTASWPVNLRSKASIKITFVTGFGSARDDVPEDAKTLIKMLTNHYYENRGECPDSELPSSLLSFIDSQTIRRIG